MRAPSHRRIVPRIVTSLLLALALPIALHAQEQVGRGKEDPNDPALAPRTPVVRGTLPARPTAPMRLRAKPAADPQKTEHFVDGGADRAAASLTPRERAKLEAARVAVAAARARGGLMAPVVQPLDLATPLQAIEAQQSAKFERLRLSQPAAVSDEPGKRGLPADPRSRQLQGPRGPSAREVEKLKAQPGSKVTPEVQKENER